MAKRGTVALRKIDIESWGSPVARQYGVSSIPRLWLYDGTERIETNTRRVMQILEGGG